LSAEVNSRLNPASKVVKDLFRKRRPYAEVRHDHQVNDFFVDFDSVGVVLDLVKKVDCAVSE
jgi:hypothetical protein